MHLIFTRRIPSTVVLLVLVFAIGQLSVARAQSDPAANDVKAEIARLEDRWLKAIEDADVPALDSILADDFVRPAPAAGQFITKSPMLGCYRSRKPSPASGNKRIENLTVQVFAGTAIARGMVVASDPNGRAVSKNLFTDIFINRGGRWQAVSAQENDLKPEPHLVP